MMYLTIQWSLIVLQYWNNSDVILNYSTDCLCWPTTCSAIEVAMVLNKWYLMTDSWKADCSSTSEVTWLWFEHLATNLHLDCFNVTHSCIHVIVIHNFPCWLPKGKAMRNLAGKVTRRCGNPHLLSPSIQTASHLLTSTSQHSSWAMPPFSLSNYPSAASSPTWPGLSCHPTEPILFPWTLTTSYLMTIMSWGYNSNWDYPDCHC